MMSKFPFLVFICLCVSMAFTTCRHKANKYDTPLQGTIYISVDESFEPVITEQIKVYEATHPDTHIIASFKSEADCFRDLKKDSIRMIIVSRGLTEEESDYFKQKLTFKPRWDALAFDAVAVIVNKQSKDSLFTLDQLRRYLDGTDTSKTILLDGKNATSTVLLLKNSLLNGKPFGKNVVAAADSKALIKYMSNHPDAIGFVGFSWVGDDDDPEQREYKKYIRFGMVECKNCGEDVFAKPSQATIASGEYPLVRPLFYILKENALGLGSGFVNFLSLERGQLIFRRSYLVPAKMDFGVRKSMMETNQNLLNKTLQ